MDSPTPPPPRRSTIYDVAEAAGVSIATVSFSFSNTKRVAPATRDRILEIAADLGYVPRAAARDLAVGRTGVLGFWTYDYEVFADPDAVNGTLARTWSWPIFVDEIERGYRREAWRQGFAVLSHGSAADNVEELVRNLASRVDGLAVMPNSLPVKTVQLLSKQIPVVTIAEATAETPRTSSVVTDNREAMHAMTTHLIDVHGARDLRFVGGVSVDFLDRFAGFQDAMRDAGLTPPEAPEGGAEAAWHAHDSAPAVRESLGRGVPDAFVCASDQHAAHTLRVLTEAGISVPDDVAVTGFDDIQASELTTPPLTTVHQPMQEMGAAAVRTLAQVVQQPSSAPLTRLEPSTLVIRRSCGCEES